MGSDKSFLEAEFEDMADECVYDPEEDSLPSDTLIIKREVKSISGRDLVIEVSITQNDEAQDGISWFKLYDPLIPENFSHFYVDTLNPELILNALEHYISQGKGLEVFHFIKEEGKSVRNPVEFRLKLEAMLGSVGVQGDMQALGHDLF